MKFGLGGRSVLLCFVLMFVLSFFLSFFFFLSYFSFLFILLLFVCLFVGFLLLLFFTAVRFVHVTRIATGGLGHRVLKLGLG